MRPAVFALVMWALLLGAAALGAKIGSDYVDAMACGCSAGWVEIEA